MPYEFFRASLYAGGFIAFGAIAAEAQAQSATVEVTDSADTTELKKIVVEEGEDKGDKHAGAADRSQSIYISSEELELVDPQSLKEVFAGDASISVGGAMTTTQKVYVNSIDELNLAVTVDGVLQNNRVFHHNTTNYVDPTLLKSVRVDPGVAPADAGPGALGGSIVYETVDAADLLEEGKNFGGYARVSYDTNSSTFTEAGSLYGRANGFEFLGYIKYADGDDYTAGDGWTIPGTAADFLSFLGKAAYQSLDGHRIEIKAQQVQDSALRPYRANFGDLPGIEPETRVYDLTQRNFSASYGIEDAQGLWDPNIVVGYSDAKTAIPTYFDRRSGENLLINSEGTAGTWTAKAENTFNLDEKNSITAGVDFYSTESEYIDDIYTIDGLREKSTNLGFYGQARLEPLDGFHLSFGARGDNQWFEGLGGEKLENFGMSGNVYATYDINDYLTINAGYSNVFGGIDLEENFVYVPSWDYAGLEPVRSQNFTAGIEFNYNGWQLTGGVYRTDFENFREADGNKDFTTEGFKLGAGYNWGNGFFRITYSNSELTVDGDHVDSYYAGDMGMPIGQVIAAEIVHSFEQYGVTVGSSLDAALEYDGPEKAGESALPGYAVFNAFVEYKPIRLPNLTLRVEANNIFDATYSDRATYGADYDDETVLQELYEPGRSFLLMAKVKF
ncbi:MAG: TonB-dependent receptor [Rhizobiaceae bacterium MnEN-MB40S]|nr:MAG: TonB-dependent receptor [Rhizobiaceae bacterium MnEN-MB40S]